MARLKYKTPEAERIFQSNNVDNRMGSAVSSMPDAVVNQLQQQALERITNPDNQIGPQTLKNTAQ